MSVKISITDDWASKGLQIYGNIFKRYGNQAFFL